MRVSTFGFGRGCVLIKRTLLGLGRNFRQADPRRFSFPLPLFSASYPFLTISILNFLGLITCFGDVLAQTTSFTKGYQTEQRGGIVLVSNNIVSCSDCDDVNQMPPGGTTDNNTRIGQYINAYPEAGIFSSSSADLILPECSEISFAGLYWGGYLTAWNSRYSQRNRVKLKLPGESQYIDVTAQSGFKPYDNNYQNFADITSSLKANGSTGGTFTLANVVANTDNINLEAGWTIVIVYKNDFKPLRNLTVFHGLDGITHGNTGELNISISGFVTPPVGPVSYELGFVAYEGDRVRNGDYMKFNDQFISDAVRSQNNVLNSSITYNGSVVTSRKPAHNNTLGYDAGIVMPDNSAMPDGRYRYIQNNSIGAVVKVATNDDTYAIGVITTAIDVYNPNFAFTHTFTNLNSPGSALKSTEKAQFEYELKNIGNDLSKNTIVSTELSPLLTDISNLQVQYNSDGIWHDLTAAQDGDEAEFLSSSNKLIFRGGTGADAGRGGDISPNATLKIRFQGTLTSDCELLRCSGGNFINFGSVDYEGNVNSTQRFNQQSGPKPLSGQCSASGPLQVNIEIPAECQTPPPDRSFTIVCNTRVSDFQLPKDYSLYAAADFSFSTPLNEVSTAGTYIARRVFTNGCEYRFNVHIDLKPITATLTKVRDVLCFGSSTGALTLKVNEFTGAYTQQWFKNGSKISTPEDLDSLSSGEYEVLIINSCQQASTGKIRISRPLEVLRSEVIKEGKVDCFGAADGIVEVRASGGTPGYTYELNNISNTTGVFTDLVAGNYTILISDANNCIITQPLSVFQPGDSLTAEISSQKDISCFGEADGRIVINASGGTGSYHFTLNNITNTTGVFTGLPAGDYTVAIRDSNNCVISQSAKIIQPAAMLEASIIDQKHNSCFGEAGGSVTVRASGGTPGYSYILNNIRNSTGEFSGLAAGTYSIAVEDINKCLRHVSVTIVQPTQLDAEVATQTNVSCFGGTNGSVVVNASGGTPGYSYTLNNIRNSTGEFIGLTAGTYSIAVEDASQCITAVSVTIVQPTQLNAEIAAQTNLSCFGGSNGSVMINASGGTPGYSYTLNNIRNSTGEFSGLGAGTYSIAVEDASKCVAVVSVTIVQPTQLNAEVAAQTNVSCFGGTNGSVIIRASGGTPGYMFTLNGNSNRTGVFSELASGSYQVTITDAAGCVVNHSVIITQPAVPLAINYSKKNVSCFDGNDGSVTVEIKGGTAPYSLVWFDDDKAGAVRSGLNAGDYKLTVTDARGCQVSEIISISQPASALSLSYIVSDVSCFGANNGAIDIHVAGGTASYTFNWSNGQKIEDLKDLSPGSYTIRVEDAGGCTLTRTIVVSQPSDPLKISFKVKDATCKRSRDGSIIASVSGGTQPYSLIWKGLADTKNTASDLSPGVYDILVTDDKGCTVSASVVISSGNCPPIAVDDGYQTGQDVPVSGNVSLNDSDPWEQLSFAITSTVKNGEIQFFKDGKFIYTPKSGFTGQDTFTYQACNTSGLCSTATATIIVTPFTVVSLTPEFSNVREGKKGTVTAKLLRPFATDIIITLSYSGKAQKEKDYILLDQYQQIRIPAGTLATSERITIAALTDNAEEGDEEVIIRIVSTSDASVRIGNGATVIINDIYPPDLPPATPVKKDIPENPNVAADPLVSPNGDGLGNEFFKIDNIVSFPDNEVVIFNRWGNEVFRIKGYNETDRVFSGFANKSLTATGSPLPDGVYYFLITTNRISDRQTITNLNKGYLILKR